MPRPGKYLPRYADLPNDVRPEKHKHDRFAAKVDEVDHERREHDARVDFAAVAAVFPLKSRID
jgi:hypothetical protein